MTVTTTLTRDEFSQAAEPLRRELFAHCYRMLGSVHEAEDMVQETYLRAWRGYDGFEGRSSLRTWLYRIATTTCLRALERAAKRPTPSGLGQAPAQSFDDPVGDALDLPWLQPAPDRLLGDPAELAVGRDNVRLAFVAALQYLPPKQRAVLILRDVLAWSADEAAELLETSRAAVNSALQRARAQLAAVPVDEIAPISDAQRRELVESFVDAYLNADMAALTKLLTEDMVGEMPPFALWFQGRDTWTRFLASRWDLHGPGVLLPTSANGQPAFGAYVPDEHGVMHGHAIMVLTAGTAGVQRVSYFLDTSLFRPFELPEALSQ